MAHDAFSLPDALAVGETVVCLFLLLWQCSRLIYLLQMAILIVNTPLPHFQQLIPLRLLSSNLAVSGKPLRLAAFKIYSIQ